MNTALLVLYSISLIAIGASGVLLVLEIFLTKMKQSGVTEPTLKFATKPNTLIFVLSLLIVTVTFLKLFTNQ